MNRLSGFFTGASQRTVPERIDTDDVVPGHFCDNVSYLRPYVLFWTFKYLEVLDADLLGKTLAAVFEADGWRRLGGRLRLKSDGKLEIHIPREFTKERPALHFTKTHFDISMGEHPEASKIPTATERPTVFTDPMDFYSLSSGPGSAKTFEDYLHSDLPQFALHVVTFTDGTLVSVTFSHVTSDAMGFRSVLDAWQAQLAGTPEKQADFMSASDAMTGLYENPPKAKQVNGHLRLSTWQMILWFMWFLWDNWQTYKTRIVSVPKASMDMLVQNARNHLARDASKGQEIPFITEGDVLLAIAARLATRNLPPTSTRSLTVLTAVDPRNRAPSVFRQDAAYVQNAPSGITAICSAAQARDLPLGALALIMREAIVAQTTEEQLRVAAHEATQALKKTGNPPLYGDASGVLTVSSSWAKAKLLQLDLSGAIVKQAVTRPGSESQWRPGLPVYYHSFSLGKATFITGAFMIAGRDHEGNMWLIGQYPDAAFPRLIKLLEEESGSQVQ